MTSFYTFCSDFLCPVELYLHNSLIPVWPMRANCNSATPSSFFAKDANYFQVIATITERQTMTASDSAMDVGGEARTFGGCEGPDAM